MENFINEDIWHSIKYGGCITATLDMVLFVYVVLNITPYSPNMYIDHVIWHKSMKAEEQKPHIHYITICRK